MTASEVGVLGTNGRFHFRPLAGLGTQETVAPNDICLAYDNFLILYLPPYSGASGAIRAASSSTWNSPPHLPQECSQCFTLMVLTAITGLVMIGVRWPQPVT